MKLEQLDLDSVEAVVDEKVEDKVIICLPKQKPFSHPYLFLPVVNLTYLWCKRDRCDKCS